MLHTVFRGHRQQFGGTDSRTATTSGESVVIARSQMHEYVHRTVDVVLAALHCRHGVAATR